MPHSMHHTQHRRTPTALRTAALVTILGIALGACSGTSSPAPSPTAEASPTPIGDTIVLDRAPENLGCDALPVDYRTVTFNIDPDADPQVWGVTDRATWLKIRWDSTFHGTADPVPVVVDGAGKVVARDGDVLVIPGGAWPDLHGHFVCPAATELFVLDSAPS